MFRYSLSHIVQTTNVARRKGAKKMRSVDAVSIVGNTQVVVTLSASTAVTAALGAGTYQALSTVDCWLKCDTSAASAQASLTSSTGFPLLAGNAVPVLVPEGFFIGAIAAGAGSLNLFKVGGAS